MRSWGITSHTSSSSSSSSCSSGCNHAYF
jgi:hypothetical protein